VSTLSPIQVDVLWNRVIAIADEAAATLISTAFSSGVRINYDFALGVFDAQGLMIAQAHEGSPGQQACMTPLLGFLLRDYAAADLQPGDVMITNDPWLGCGHTPDIYIVTPVFHDAGIGGYIVNCAHHIDIGGSLVVEDTHDLFEEGLQIPPSRLYRGGEPNEELFALLRKNVRYPDQVIGDIRAQLAANHVAVARLHRLMREQRMFDLHPLATRIVQKTEAAMRAAIESIPDGTYEFGLDLEESDRRGKRLRIKAKMQIAGSEVLVDYAGTSPQVDKPINSVLNYTHAYTILGLKMASVPDLPNNLGTSLPVKISVPERSLLNPEYPAPVRQRTQVGQLLPEMILRVLAKAVPERVVAETGSVPMWVLALNGRRRDGRIFVGHSHYMGGMGARSFKDGVSCVKFPGNMADMPSELLEHEAPVVVEKREFVTDSGGAGKYRGGLGQEVVFRMLAEEIDPATPIVASVRVGRLDRAPEGLADGLAGAKGRVRLNGEDIGTQNRITSFLGPDGFIEFITPGGGGYHPPRERDPEKVLTDVRRGFVSPQAAREIYGVDTAAATAPDTVGPVKAVAMSDL
jgi:N-methylhydantoinase B/oxoprolinase/acetone carboxylase alpha subunit